MLLILCIVISDGIIVSDAYIFTIGIPAAKVVGQKMIYAYIVIW